MCAKRTEAASRPRAVIVGGGLAGLTAALELVERGYHISLYEGREDLGGKAASLKKNAVYDRHFKLVKRGLATEIQSDHGYHVFPKWYVNMRNLWRRIELPPSDVYESGDYYGLHRGTAYHFTPPEPKADRERFSLLDLVTRSDEEVDNLSFRGFLYSRIYNDLDSVSLNALFLNALSIPEYDISSRVVRNLFRQWMPVLDEDNWAGLKGSLGEVLIYRIVEAIRKREKQYGGRFELKQGLWLDEITLEGGEPELHFYSTKQRRGSGRGKPKESVSGVPIILAIPLDVLRNLQSDALFAAEPAIGRLNHLRANQFGAIDLWFRERLPKVPIDHFDLLESRYNLSAFDISQHWPVFAEKGYGGTVLQFVAGSCKELVGLSEEGFARAMVAEIAQYLPAASTDALEFVVSHRNASQPLFVNDVGTWDARPPVRGNLFYFAGDYVQNETDITSMEGAVRSGLNAAEALRLAQTPHTVPVQILPPIGFSDDQLARMRQEKVIPGRLKMFLEYRLKELFDGL